MRVQKVTFHLWMLFFIPVFTDIQIFFKKSNLQISVSKFHRTFVVSALNYGPRCFVTYLSLCI
jgi:hypothetical protein